MRRFLGFFMMLVLPLFLSNCKQEEINVKLWDENNLTLKDFAYYEESETPYEIHLEEGGKLVPYLVLSDDYGGNCLLLRKYLLDESRVYNYRGRYSGYYENSEIDKFLNGEFIETLSICLKDKIAETDLVITAKESLGIGGKNTIIITRKIFLLAFSEVEEGKSRTNLYEGDHLPFFSTIESRIAYKSLGIESSWWLRTANTATTESPNIVIWSGATNIGATYGMGKEYKNAVRPAFCLPGDMKVVKAAKEADIVYVISEDEQN